MDSIPNHIMSTADLKKKKEDLQKVAEALNLKYQQIQGQIELINDMLDQKIGRIESGT